MTDRDARIDAVRRGLSGAPGVGGEEPSRVEALVEEFVPFIDAAIRAEAGDGVEGLWREARSLAWLFAYRAGDQGFAPLGVSAAVDAWREAVGTPWAAKVYGEVHAMVLDGFSKAREDRARATLQRAFVEALPVEVVARGVVLAVAAGPLDLDAAAGLVERAGQAALKADARAVVLCVRGAEAMEPAVLSELMGLEASASMLGATLWVCGAPESARDAAKRPVRDAASLSAALEGAFASVGIAVGLPEGLFARARWILRAEGFGRAE